MQDAPFFPNASPTSDRWQRSRDFVRHRLYGMKHVSECSCHPSSSVPVEMLDSTSMETKPLRRR